MTRASIEELLGTNKYEVDGDEAHIVVDEDACARCSPGRCACVRACPAGLFKIVGATMKFDYAGCLECGTCRLVCLQKAIRWDYPRGGFGVEYRYS
jgi:ferredoxin like protein